uniref:Transmembrane protein n=1 Tax=Mimivirus LCMiAC02 TaxID=2506609 RepID=A0A481Z0P1_9VIRU|nr:MAG: hypothetical protein LCMiAC02_00820 [Mimivirus LCMiAC02]
MSNNNDSDNNDNHNNNKYYRLLTYVPIIVSTVSFIFDVWGITLYYILNNTGDTSKMKDLILAYSILQAITCVATMLFACGGGGWLTVSYFCNCTEIGAWVVFLSILISAVISVISIISTIVLSGFISYEFFSNPWTNVSVSYNTILTFVIDIIFIHIIETFGLILIACLVVIFCCIYRKYFIKLLLSIQYHRIHN